MSLLSLAASIAAQALPAYAQAQQQDGAPKAAAEQGQEDAAAPPPPAAPPEADEPTQEVTRTIVVTGTRIQTPNRQSASPVETVRPEDFTLTGVPNVEQTLNQLPQLVPGFTNTSNNPGTGAATLDLRGLGSVRTLVLVNGRRWIANDAGQIPETDVNTIPSALVDRVDIVTGGASAVYGSDAVTGVINFVLRDRLHGLHLEARSNITEVGDGRSLSADASYGRSFLDRRGNLIASVGWLEQAPILQGDRDFGQVTLGDACVIAGSQDELGIGTPAPTDSCTGPNVEWGLIRQGSPFIPESAVRLFVLFPGVPGEPPRQVISRFAPGGVIVPHDQTRETFNFAPFNYLQVPLQRISGNVLASLELSDHLEPYVELSYIRTRSPQQLAPATAFLGPSSSVPMPVINLDNPFLSDQAREILEFSFGSDAEGFTRLGRAFISRLTGLGPRRAENERHAYRGLGGVRGELFGSWSYDAFYSHSYVKHHIRILNSASARRLQQAMLARRDPVTGEIVCIDPSGGCVPINIFGQQDISPEAAEFLRLEPLEKTVVEEQVAEAVAKGELIELPAGQLQSVLGASWRRTSYDFRPDRSFEQGDALGFLASTAAAGETKVFELFSEALVPLMSGRRFAEELSAELGLRYSNYDTVGGVWTWKATGSWSPVRALRVRGGLQKAVRAPNARELYEESAANFGFAPDPCNPFFGFVRDEALVAACARSGAPNLPPAPTALVIHTSGSQDLKAETARTKTLGVVGRPLSWMSGSADYYDIDIRDAIGIFGGGPEFVVAGCIFGGGDPADPLCQAFVRAPSGVITDVFVPTANLSRLKARGVDWQINGNWRLFGGGAQLLLSGTRLIASDVQINPNLADLRCAGSFGFPCGNTIQGVATPKWKLYNRATWSRGPLTLKLRHRFFSSTKDARFAQSEVLRQPPPTNIPVNAVKMQSRHYFDLATTFDVARRFQLTLGINNLTDAKPSLVGFQQVQANTDPSLYDVLGRRFFVTVAARPF